GVPDRPGAVARAAGEVSLTKRSEGPMLRAVSPPSSLAKNSPGWKRVHLPRSAVGYGTELWGLKGKSGGLSRRPNGGGDDSLAQSRDDAPCHEDVLRGPRAHGISG